MSATWLPKTQIARTRWSMFDRFIEALADMGDRVCEEAPEGEYLEIQRLLCRGDTSVVPRHAPYYHYVFAAFYALFHRGDVRLAEAVANILAESHIRDEFTNGYEAEAIHVLTTAVRAVKAADCSRPEVFKAQLKLAAEIIRAGGDGTDSWSNLFRELTAAYLEAAPGAAGRIKKAVEEILRGALETAEAYGVPPDLEYAAAPPLYFIYMMAERLEKEGYPLEKLCSNDASKFFTLNKHH